MTFTSLRSIFVLALASLTLTIAPSTFAQTIDEQIEELLDPNWQPKPEPKYVGLWHFHSSGGYSGYIALDASGGCSYFVSSAVLTIQATCISRELENGQLVIFGTQEGISSTAPAYGDQLGTGYTSANPQAGSTAITFIIKSASQNTMQGQLITPSKKENVQFKR